MDSSTSGEDDFAAGDFSPAGVPGYAVLWCPDFALQAVVRRVHAKAEPTALVDDSKRQSVIRSRNEAARLRGIDPGMRTVQALARCPGLRVERPSAPAELAAARTLLETAFGWVPGIEETEEGMFTLDLSTQSRERWRESARRIRGRLYEGGLEVVVGLGETPSLARLAALAARERGESFWSLEPDRRLEMLDGIPLSLGLPAGKRGEELGGRLRLWGIASLGAFARLRREAVAARLGDEGIELWLRLTGRLRRPLRFAKLEQLFEAHHDFDHEVREREPLFFVVNRFLEDLSARVARTGRAVTAVHVLLGHADGRRHARRLALPEPVLDHEVLFHLVSGHIEGLEMKAPVESVRLRLEPVVPAALQRSLFGTGLRNRHRFEETMRQLRRIVGSERVGSLRRVDSHRPGAFELAPLPAELGAGEGRGRGEATLSGPPGPPVTGAPLRRFRFGTRAVMRFGGAASGSGPVRVESRVVSGVVADAAGPWRCAGEWWHRGRSWKRVEWDVEIRGHGVFRIVEEEGEWKVEGRYG